jgi:hypothetical protein
MKIIKGDLIMTEDMTFHEDLKVEGNIFGKDGKKYNLNAHDINAWNIDACDIDAWNINAHDINAHDINAFEIDADNINFYAVAIAYYSFKCKSWKSRRNNFVIKCLDGEIEIKKEKKICEKVGEN